MVQQRHKSGRDLTQGDIARHLIILTLPMIFGVLSIKIFNLVDTFFVGQIGTQELAAISFTFPIVLIFGNFSIGLGIGTSSLVARAVGKGHHYEVARLVTDHLVFTCLMAVIATLVGILTINPVFRLLGAPEPMLPIIKSYMLIWYVGLGAMMIPMVGHSALRATGNTAFPATQMIIAAVLNCVLDPLLIFGYGIVPRFGMDGAALAAVISKFFTLLATVWVLFHREKLITLKGFSLIQAISSWRALLRISAPAALTNMIVPLSAAVVTAQLANYGPHVVAGFGVASRIEGFAVVLFLALSSTIGPLVGQNWGAREYARSKLAVKYGVLFCFIFGAIVTAILMIGSNFFVGVFSKERAVVETAALYLLIVSSSYGAQGAVYIVNATFNALGYALRSTTISILRIFVLYIPLALLGELFFGFAGIFLGAGVANFAAALVGYFWLNRTLHRSAAAQAV